MSFHFSLNRISPIRSDSALKYRLVRSGLKTKKEGSRKLKRELKNRKNKVRGKEKAKVGKTAAKKGG